MSEKAEDATFEEALKNLEKLIEMMESGDVPLAQLVEKYAEGDKLLKTCESRLKEAELKIEQLKSGTDKTAFESVADKS
jgi:exodeoxyribonuclease VII small subunit|tara:strand:- start:320 stop:556 length:237 start_codon:yes stop_codon:yes gene_type:complete